MTQITVLPGVERRHRWSDDRKLALVEAAIAPTASVAATARCRRLALVDLSLAAVPVQQAYAPTGFAAVTVRTDPTEIDHGMRCAGHRSSRCDPSVRIAPCLRACWLRQPRHSLNVLLGHSSFN
jgi:transposase